MTFNKTSRPLRILLVEDSEHDFIAFRRALQKNKAPAEITHYIRAEDALERLSVDTDHFDLVVTDYKLPGMSGLELCRELIESKIPLPIVILIGTGSNGLAVNALKIGVDDYLIKDPFRGYLDHLPVILFDAVRKHASRLASKRPDGEILYSDAHYPVIIEDQTELIRCFSIDGTLTFVNDAYCRFFDEKRENLIGKDFMQNVSIEDQENIKRHMASFSRENPVQTIECRVIKPGGEIYWQEWTDRAIINEQGSINTFQSIGRDITEIKDMREAITQGNDLFHSLVELMPDGFFICDIRSGDFLLINQNACNLFGYAMQEMLASSLWDRVSIDEQERLQENIQTRLMDEILKPWREVYNMIHKDGAAFEAELSSSLIRYDGDLVLQCIIRELKEK